MICTFGRHVYYKSRLACRMADNGLCCVASNSCAETTARVSKSRHLGINQHGLYPESRSSRSCGVHSVVPR